MLLNHGKESAEAESSCLFIDMICVIMCIFIVIINCDLLFEFTKKSDSDCTKFVCCAILICAVLSVINYFSSDLARVCFIVIKTLYNLEH